MTNRRRYFFHRQFIVNPRLQMEILAYHFVILSVLFGFLFWNLVRFVHQLRTAPHEVLGNLSVTEGTLVRSFIAAYLISIALTAVGSALLSNRIAGPIYRLTLALKRAARGESVGEIVFREQDFFHETAEAINVLIQARKEG